MGTGIRSDHPLHSVVAGYVNLKRVSGGRVGCCPFHPDRTPSFNVYNLDDKFHCYGCGAHGDVVDFLEMFLRVDKREAVVMLTGQQFPAVAHRPKPPRPKTDTSVLARRLWREAAPIAGTSAEAYLRSRAIDCALPETLRFARLPYPDRTGLLPCLVALVTTAQNKVGGIQRTYVLEDGTGKAAVPNAKLSLGSISGGAIRLAPVAADLMITGGIEDGLSMQQMFGTAVWVSAGESNMANLSLPDAVKHVTIGADADPAGGVLAQQAAEAFSLQGRGVKIILPLRPYKDFNAELVEERA